MIVATSGLNEITMSCLSVLTVTGTTSKSLRSAGYVFYPCLGASEMTASIIGIIIGLGVTMYCMMRSWQSLHRAGDTHESRVVSLVVSIIFALIGTYMASYTWHELMEIL